MLTTHIHNSFRIQICWYQLIALAIVCYISCLKVLIIRLTIHSANHELLEHYIVSHKFLKYLSISFKFFFNNIQMYTLFRHLHPVCRGNKFPFHPTSLILKPPIQSIRLNAISPKPILPPKTKESEVLIRINAISPNPFLFPRLENQRY